MVSFKSVSKALSVSRGDGSYIDFVNGEYSTDDANEQAILRGIEGIEEVGSYKPPKQSIPKRGPLNPEVVNWYSPVLGVADGYGSSAEHMVLALERAGKKVSIAPGSSLSGETHIKEILERSFIRGADRIVYCPPHPNAWKPQFDGQRVFGFSMWEDSILPHAWDASLAAVDAIMAPSTFCVKLFEDRLNELGLEKPVHYIPLGVDHKLYPYNKRSFHKGNEPFTVLHCSTGLAEERKGALLAYEAFCKAFPVERDVKLVFRARQGTLPIDDARVEFDCRVISDAEKLQSLYNAHVLLYPSFGEGFGLIPLEAIASGLPAIVALNSGMADYQDLFTPIGCDPEISGISVYFQRDSRGEWMRPRVDEAATALRSMYENYETTVSPAAKAAKTVQKKWTYDRSARAILDVLEG